MKRANIFLIVGGLLAGFFIFELLLSLIPQRQETVPDPVLGYKWPPFYEGNDANGFRNENVVTQSDIVAIGDSQTYGTNAETYHDTWPGFLENMLGKKIYQLAVGGYGPAEYSYLLRTQALSLSPKLAIIGFYTGNDATNAYSSVYNNDYWKDLRKSDVAYATPKPSDQNEELSLKYGYDPNSWKFKALKLRLWFASHSRVYKLLGHVSWNVRVKLGLARSQDEVQQEIEKEIRKQSNGKVILYENDAIGTILRPEDRIEAIDLSNPRVQEGIRVTEELFIRDMKMLGKTHGTYIVAIIPTKELVYGTYLQETHQPISDVVSSFVSSESEYLKKFLEFCEINSIYCINLRPALTNALKSGVRIYPAGLDGHPMPEGYRIIAGAIKEFMERKKIILD